MLDFRNFQVSKTESYTLLRLNLWLLNCAVLCLYYNLLRKVRHESRQKWSNKGGANGIVRTHRNAKRSLIVLTFLLREGSGDKSSWALSSLALFLLAMSLLVLRSSNHLNNGIAKKEPAYIYKWSHVLRMNE